MFKVKNASPTYHDTSTADAQSAAADGGYYFAAIGNTLRRRDRVADSQVRVHTVGSLCEYMGEYLFVSKEM